MCRSFLNIRTFLSRIVKTIFIGKPNVLWFSNTIAKANQSFPTDKHIWMHQHTQTQTCTYTHKHRHTHKHTHTSTTNIHTHTQTHMYTHTHTQHILMPAWRSSAICIDLHRRPMGVKRQGKTVTLIARPGPLYYIRLPGYCPKPSSLLF